MSCSPFDLRDYFLKELPDADQRQVEAHVRTCQGCREELERLRITEAALFALREEEIPQRIAFVSDKIFEPSGWQRWWGALWGSAARLGFASAAMLSVAIVVYAVRPVGQGRAVPATPPVVQTLSEAQIDSRVDAAVTKAVAVVEARQQAQTQKLMADLESTRRRLLVAASEYEYYQKRTNAFRVTASNYSLPPSPAQGDGK